MEYGNIEGKINTGYQNELTIYLLITKWTNGRMTKGLVGEGKMDIMNLYN